MHAFRICHCREDHVFGPGTIREIIDVVPSLGKRCLVVAGRKAQRWSLLLDELTKRSIAITIFSVPKEPTTATVVQGVSMAREHGCDCVLALGGGSVIDTGKAIAALMTNAGELFDYLEVVGKAMPLTQPACPVHRGADDRRHGQRGDQERGHPLRGARRQGEHALPLPASPPGGGGPRRSPMSLPPMITASTGLDALTQLLESYVSEQCESPDRRHLPGRASRGLPGH
ncbi:MAG: iron-containing alcohol dehydrogenase [Candidatus Moduliflexus flocculans]|nr:iron-containing alcohol dehydrogenase [Candidatus Moduliflexus flocculans]